MQVLNVEQCEEVNGGVNAGIVVAANVVATGVALMVGGPVVLGTVGFLAVRGVVAYATYQFMS